MEQNILPGIYDIKWSKGMKALYSNRNLHKVIWFGVFFLFFFWIYFKAGKGRVQHKTERDFHFILKVASEYEKFKIKKVKDQVQW